MQVIASSRSAVPGTEKDGVRFVTREELLKSADVVSLHCPLTPETEGLINRASIEWMKHGAILINTGRGPLVVEKDLADALNTGRLYAAGLDVAAQEPIPKDSPLIEAKNCFITPHIAWATFGARRRLVDITVENLRSFLEGKPVHVVNG